MDKTKIVKNIFSTVMMMVDVEDLQHQPVYFPWYNYIRNIYIYTRIVHQWMSFSFHEHFQIQTATIQNFFAYTVIIEFYFKKT